MQLPPTPPGPNDRLELHDALFVRLRVEDFGRRVKLSLVVCGGYQGRYDQPVEVVIEGFDYLFWADDTEDDRSAYIRHGGPTEGEHRYGRFEHEQGLDFTVRCGGMNLTVIRARTVTSTALLAVPPSMTTDVDPPMNIRDLHALMHDRDSSPEASLHIEVVELELEQRKVVVRFAKAGAPPSTARARYAGISTIELDPIAPNQFPGVVGAAVERPHGDATRLQLSCKGMRLSLVGREWQRASTAP